MMIWNHLSIIVLNHKELIVDFENTKKIKFNILYFIFYMSNLKGEVLRYGQTVSISPL